MNLEKEIFEISLVDIIPNRFQPREIFDDEGLKELSESIKVHGVIQPIIVRKVGDKYEIIAGERRYRASELAGKQTIPALVRDIDDKEAAKIALLENLQRRDLSPIEEAKTYQTILRLDNITQDELAKNLGKSQSAIANKLRLLNLDEEVQTALLNSQISERHARSLLALDNEKQKELLHKVVNERLTVRQLDEKITKLTGKQPEVEQEEEGNDNMVNDINSSMNAMQSEESENTNSLVNATQAPTTSEVSEIAATDESFNTPTEESQPESTDETKSEQPTTEPLPEIPTPDEIPTSEEPVLEPLKENEPKPQEESIEPTNLLNKTIAMEEQEKDQKVIPEESIQTGDLELTNPLEQPVLEAPEIPLIQEDQTTMPPIAETQVNQSSEEITLPNIATSEEQPEKAQEAVGTMPTIEPAPGVSLPGITPEVVTEQPVVEQPVAGTTAMPAVESAPTMPTIEPVPEVSLPGITPEVVTEQPTIEPVVSEQPQERPRNIFDSLRINPTSTEPVVETPIEQSTEQPQDQENYNDIYDIRFAINNFRQAVQNTEKFGFKVNVEEKDNDTSYQIVINIEKKN